MMKRTTLALVLLALAPSAPGQIIYRSTMPDGRTVLSDRPTPGAKKVEQYYVPPSPTSDIARPAPQQPASGGARSPALNRDSGLDAAIAKLRSAENALRSIEAARAAGEEPQENERQGTVAGGSRLNDTYFDRQKALDEAVEIARKGVAEAQAKVNSLR